MKKTIIGIVCLGFLVLLSSLLGIYHREQYEVFLASLTTEQKEHIEWVREALSKAPENTLVLWDDGVVSRIVQATPREVRMRSYEAFAGNSILLLEGKEKIFLKVVDIVCPSDKKYKELAVRYLFQQ